MEQFRVALDAAPLNRDFYLPIDHNGMFISEHVIAPLARPLGDDLGIALAKASFSRSGECELYLKEIRWAPQLAMQADDVVRCLRRYFSPQGLGWLRGHIIPMGRPRITTPDSRTVRLNLGESLSYLPHLLALPGLSPRPPSPVADSSLGPYRYRIRARSYEMTRNPARSDLAGALLPYGVTAMVIDDQWAAIRMFERGELEMTATTGLSSEAFCMLSGHPSLVTRALDIFGHLEFGQRASGLRRDPELRAGLARVVDVTRLTAAAPGLLAAHPNARSSRPGGIPRRLTSALREANGIVYADFPPNGQVVDRLIDQVAAATGLRLSSYAVGLSEYGRLMATGDFPMAYTLTMPEFNHNASALMPWHSSSPFGVRSGFGDGLLDQLLENAAFSAIDDPSAWSKAKRRLRDLMMRIPLTQVIGNFLLADSWSELNINVTGTISVDSYPESLASRARGEMSDARKEEINGYHSTG